MIHISVRLYSCFRPAQIALTNVVEAQYDRSESIDYVGCCT